MNVKMWFSGRESTWITSVRFWVLFLKLVRRKGKRYTPHCKYLPELSVPFLSTLLEF